MHAIRLVQNASKTNTLLTDVGAAVTWMREGLARREEVDLV